MEPRQNAKIIKAWADGHEVQWSTKLRDAWAVWDMVSASIPLGHPNSNWRVKPAKSVVKWLWATKKGSLIVPMMTEEEAKSAGDFIRIEGTRTKFPPEGGK